MGVLEPHLEDTRLGTWLGRKTDKEICPFLYPIRDGFTVEDWKTVIFF